MDWNKLADVLIPDENVKPLDYYETKYPERNLPMGAQVTRLAPSPTGFIHLGNLFVIRDVGYVLLQTISAFSAGMCYAVSAILMDSLLPCVVAHFFVNITAAPDMDIRTGALWVCSGISCFCYYYFGGKKIIVDKGES